MSDEAQLLTPDEMECLEYLRKAAVLGFKIIGQNGVASEQDSREWAHDIHVLQHTIMAQASARAYPDQFRLLGRSLYRQGGSI